MSQPRYYQSAGEYYDVQPHPQPAASSTSDRTPLVTADWNSTSASASSILQAPGGARSRNSTPSRTHWEAPPSHSTRDSIQVPSRSIVTGSVALTFILILVGFIIQIHGTMESATTPVLLFNNKATRFAAFYFVLTWLSSLISLYLRRPALLSISAAMLVAICSIVEPIIYLDILRLEPIPENQKALAGGILCYLGAGGMFFITARYQYALEYGTVVRESECLDCRACWSALIFLGTLVLNIIGAAYVLLDSSAGYVGLATVPVFLSVSFVFLTGVLFRSSVLINTSAVLASVLLVDSVQVVLALSESTRVNYNLLTGYVTLWTSSFWMILYRYSVADYGGRPSEAVRGPAGVQAMLPGPSSGYGAGYDGSASLLAYAPSHGAASDNIGLSATNHHALGRHGPAVAHATESSYHAATHVTSTDFHSGTPVALSIAYHPGRHGPASATPQLTVASSSPSPSQYHAQPQASASTYYDDDTPGCGVSQAGKSKYHPEAIGAGAQAHHGYGYQAPVQTQHSGTVPSLATRQPRNRRAPTDAGDDAAYSG